MFPGNIPMPSDLSANCEEDDKDPCNKNFIENRIGETKSLSFQNRDDLHYTQSCFLFNITDPVWKPICEFDEVSAVNWPDNHEQKK